MRLWSLHPRYLDSRGLVALWREALLAQAVLNGRTRGYTHHPQLLRFRESEHPARAIARYLMVVHDEATRRGYKFDRQKIENSDDVRDSIILVPLPVSRGQVRYEWNHLLEKLARRAPEWLESMRSTRRIEAHPVFQIASGPVEKWEKNLIAK